MPGAKLVVFGLRDLQKELRSVDKDLPKVLRRANLAAAEVIAEEARKRAPVDGGSLRKSIKATAGQRDASVKAGSPSRVPYAGPAHWGWYGRPQGGYNPENPFIQAALTDKYDEMKEVYRKEVDELKDQAGL